MVQEQADRMHPYLLTVYNASIRCYQWAWNSEIPNHQPEGIFYQTSGDRIFFHEVDINPEISTIGSDFRIPSIRLALGIIPQNRQMFVLLHYGTSPNRSVRLEVFGMGYSDPSHESLLIFESLRVEGEIDGSNRVKESHGFVINGDGQTPLILYLYPLPSSGRLPSVFYFYGAEWEVI